MNVCKHLLFTHAPQSVSRYRQRLIRGVRSKAGRGRSVSVTYADTRYWFFEGDGADAYDAQAAKLAWSRAVEFLKNYIA